MKDHTFKVLLGIIAVNLTIQTVKDVGLFPTAYAQDDNSWCYDVVKVVLDHDRRMSSELDSLRYDQLAAKNAIMDQIIIFSN